MARGFHSDAVHRPAAFFVTGLGLGQPGVPYRIVTSGGNVTTSNGVNSSTHSTIQYGTWADFLAAESGQWTLTMNHGQAGETDYFFNVGFESIAPEPMLIDAYHVSGAPSDQWTIDISGSIDRGPFQFDYSYQTDHGRVSENYNLPAGTSTLNLTVEPGSSFLAIHAMRFIYTNEITVSVPTTIDGAPLPGWNVHLVAYQETASFLMRSVPAAPEPVPDTASTLGLFLAGLGAMIAWDRRQQTRPFVSS